MKNLILLNRSGMSPEVTCRKGRHAIESIVSRFSVASLICLCMLTIGSGNAWGATATWTLVESAPSDWSGEYLIVYNNNCFDGSLTSGFNGNAGQAVTISSKSITLDDKYAMIIAKPSGYTLQTASGYYLGRAANSNGVDASNSSSYTVTITWNNTSKTAKIAGTGGRCLGNNSGSWKFFSSSNAYVNVSLYKKDSGGGSTPSLTADPTSLDWGSVLQSSSQSTKTFDISGSNLTGNLSVAVTGGYSVSCGSSITVTSGTPTVSTITVTPPSTANTGTKNGKVTISGGGLASNVEVDLSMTVNAASTVTWMVNGSEYTTTLVANGSKPEFPSNPSSCDGTSTIFVGWTPTPWSGKLDDVSAKTIYTSGAAMPNVGGAVTYHAVFAAQSDFTRVNNTSELATGKLLVIVDAYNSKTLNTDLSASTAPTETSGKITPSANMIWTLEANSTNWKLKTGSNYLKGDANPTSSSKTKTISLGTSGYLTWVIASNSYTNNGTPVFSIRNSSSGNAGLEYSNGWKLYYTTNLNTSYYTEKLYISSYSKYLTTCCTSWSDPTFSYNTYSLTAGGAHATKTITGTTHGTLSFESSNTDVITVNSSTGEVTPVGAGTAHVIAHWTAADGYCEKSMNSSDFTVTGNLLVTFKKNGGTGTDDQTQSVPYNTATALKTLAQVGYTAPSCKEFYGWADSQAKADAGTRDYTDGQSVTLTTGKTLYAVWKTIQYTVARGTGTATGCSGGTFTFSPSTVDCGGTVTITSSPDDNHKGSPTVTILPAGSGTVSGNTITGVSGNITSISVSYAEKVDVTATWNVNNGSVTGGGTTTQKEGSTFTFPNVTSTDCGTFLGWTNAANSSYSSTSGKPTPFYSVGSTIVLNENTQFYAVYSKVSDDAVSDVLYHHADDGTDLSDDDHTGVTATGSGLGAYSSGSYYLKFDDAGDNIIFELDGTPTSFNMKFKTMTGGSDPRTAGFTLYESDSKSGPWTAVGSEVTQSGTSTAFELNITNAALFSERVLKVQMTTRSINAGGGEITINGLRAAINYTTNPGCVDWVLDAISVTTAPTKTTYNECEEFDPAGMVVTGSYYENGNPSNTMTKDVAGYTWSPEQFLTPGNTIPVTITYTEKAVTKTTTYNVRVNDLTNYTITFHDGGNTTTWTQSNHCDACNLDGRTGSLACGDYTFAGWSSSSTSYDDQSATITTWVTGSYVPTTNTDLYAVYRKGAAPPAFTANCEGGTFYIYEANGNTHMAGRVNNTPRAYTSEYWNDDCLSCEGDDGTPFTFTRIADNTYKIQNHDGEYLRKYYGGNHPDFESTWYNEDNFKWIISAGTNGTWRFTSKAATDYALVKSGNYFDFQLASNVTALSSYYDLELTPAASTVYQSNPNCGSPYTITFETHGGSFVQGNYAYSTATTSGLTDPTASKFPSATMTGCTFVGWKDGSAQDEITSNAAEADVSDAPAGLYAANADLSVSSNKTYHAVYHYYDDDWTFDSSEGGTYHMYTLISGTKHYIAATPTNSWAYLTTSTDCGDVKDVTITPGTGANAGKYTIAVDGYNIIPENGGTKFKRGDFWWTITPRGDGTYAINGMNDNRNIVSGSSGSQFEHCAYNAQGSYSGWYYPYFGRCRQHHWTSTPTITPSITLGQTGNIYITSTNDKTIKATNKLTLSATRYGTTTKIYLSANVAGVGFLKADGTTLPYDSHGTYISTESSGELATTNIVVTYSPTVTTDGIETVTITAQDNSSPSILATASRTIHVRHLPAKFLIATKVGDDWYALPNNMTAYGNPAAIKLSSVNEATGVATYYSDQYDGEAVGSKNYLTWALYAPVNSNNANYGYTQHGDRLRFADTYGPAHYLELKASDDDIKNSVQSPNTTDHPLCELLPGTNDLIDYTLYNEGQSKYLGVDGSKLWGAYVGSTTVRFLIPNQQPAPTITWYNDMLDADHATNKAENGVVTLPTGADPLCCDAARDVLTFDGWVTTTWDGYKTTGFTKVNNGDAATTDKTYYAVFKTSDNKYFTNCPTIVTVTYTANGGTGSNVVESYPITSSLGTSVTLKDVTANGGTIGFSKDGYVFVGWTTSSNYGSEFKYAGNTVTVKEEDNGDYGNLTLSAVWVGELTITGDVHLTSTYTSSARSEANTVYTTSDPNNLITFSITGVPASLASNLKLRASYLTSDDAAQDKNTCPFRLCNDGSSNYNIVDNSNLSITSGNYSQTYAIGYKPGVTGGTNGTTETYKLKMELINSGGDKVFDTKTLTMYGRVLPTHFVIAAKINGQWCALPADIATSSANAIANAYPITVNNQTTPTVATAAPKTALYSASVRAHNDHRGGVRLVTAVGDGNDGQLQATRSDNAYLWRTTSDCTTGMQEWYLQSSNFNQYEVRLDPKIKRSSTDAEDGADGASYVTRQLCVNGSQILFGTTSAKTMYILPVTEEFVPVEIQVVTWKSNAVQFMYLGNPAYTAEVEIEGVNKASAQALGSALKIDLGVYEIAVSDLMSNANKQLHIIIKNGDTEIGRKAVTIPLMTNSATTVNAARTAASINKGDCSGVDLVVLSNVLTADDGTAHEFKSVTVYGGAKLKVTGKLTAKTMYLRAGSVTASTKGTTPVTSYSYLYPQVYVGSSSTLTINDNTIHFDYLTNYEQYFGLALPYPVTINATTGIYYPVDIYGAAAKRGSFLLRAFDSKIRAEQGAVNAVWVDVEEGSEGSGGSIATQSATVRGLGYTMLGVPLKVSVNGATKARQTYGIHRMEMDITSGGSSTLKASENADAVISVTAYGAEALTNTGWMLLGNPYMANLGAGDRVSGASITVGSIGANAQGQYEWQNKTVRYVTVPDDTGGDTYDQRRVVDYDFPAFKPFYVQIGSSGDVTFSQSSRAADAPRRFYEEEKPSEIETSIALNNTTHGDTTHLLIGEAFSDEYEMGDDLVKMPHTNVALFTIAGNNDLFANALNIQSASTGIPVGYTAPTAGTYVFSQNDKADNTWIEHLWLKDKDLGLTTDLLVNSYEFETEAETNKTRFVLIVELKEKVGITTDIDENRGESEYGQPMKFIYQDKMYILHRGVIFDATGKKVREIK